MFRRKIFILATFGLLVCLLYATSTPPAPAQAIESILSTAVLSGASEVPPNNSAASGTAKIAINTAANTLSFVISYIGLSSAEAGAHIHGPADVGVNAEVLFALPPGNPKTGVWNYPESAEADILAGRTYINIHSQNFLGGEIRGQIMP